MGLHCTAVEWQKPWLGRWRAALLEGGRLGRRFCGVPDKARAAAEDGGPPKARPKRRCMEGGRLGRRFFGVPAKATAAAGDGGP